MCKETVNLETVQIMRSGKWGDDGSEREADEEDEEEDLCRSLRLPYLPHHYHHHHGGRAVALQSKDEGFAGKTRSPNALALCSRASLFVYVAGTVTSYLPQQHRSKRMSPAYHHHHHHHPTIADPFTVIIAVSLGCPSNPETLPNRHLRRSVTVPNLSGPNRLDPTRHGQFRQLRRSMTVLKPDSGKSSGSKHKEEDDEGDF
ncbi:hypothetical protein CMV_007762 [Castanea mollissima]|uniref:Uncharacterized protein n=1 Tax=Castanea mollissima TaxID=60419 RepID=A0A8J4VSM3_9ROSI|nr:hypothetical protein CMV_007762 [Castanea mollissima]